jgi:hypothetical protein
MMGYQPEFQPKLFYHQINLEQRVPKDHLLRKIQEKIDFNFIYAEVKDTFGGNGNVSIPPPVILKSNDSVIDTQSLKIHLDGNYKKLEARLEEVNGSSGSSRRYVKKNSRYMLTFDHKRRKDEFSFPEHSVSFEPLASP